MDVEFSPTDAVNVMAFLGNGILGHVVNDIGVMGAGIAKAIAEEWPIVEQEYLDLVAEIPNFETFGKVLFVSVTKNLVVANMFAQNNIKGRTSKIPLQYDWLQTCLNSLFKYAIENEKDIHIPRIGAGLAGGNWDKIWYMVLETGFRLEYKGKLVLHQWEPTYDLSIIRE